MTPVAKTRAQGGVPVEDSLRLQAGRIESSSYTGGGCVVGPYSQILVNQVKVGVDRTEFFLKAQVYEEPALTAEWKGRITGREIEGEVIFTGGGKGVTAAKIEEAIAELWRTEYERQLIYINNEPVNESQL